MMLRRELRRSAAPVIGVGFLVCSLALIYSLSGRWWEGTASWHEEWTGLAQWTRNLTQFLWPLVLGAGAWQGLRDERSRVTELFATTPKAAWRRMLPTAGAVALALTAGCVALLVVGGAQVTWTTSYFHLKWLPVAGVMVVAMVGIALLGMGIGRLAPFLVMPPLLTVAALGVQIVGMFGTARLLMPAFRSDDISVFTTVSVSVTLTQALWFAGVGATGFGLFVATRATARVAALLPVALTAAVAVPVLSNVDDPTVPDAGARALVCDEDGPRVCVMRAHADVLPLVVEPAREALTLMEKLPVPPASVVEMVTDEAVGPLPPDIAPLFLLLPPQNPEWVRLSVLAGIGTPACPTEYDPTPTHIAQIIMASWLTGKLTPLPGYYHVWETSRTQIQQEWQALLLLPPTEQTTRVAVTRDAILGCRDVPPLTTP